MADLGGVFDADSVEPMGDRSPIPAGDYRAVCVKSQWKPTSTGGQMLEFTWQILEGPHARRMVWSKLNLQNANAKAVEIARSELSAICKAVGVTKLTDSMQAHDIPVVLSVGIQPPQNGYDASNSVKGYKSVRAASESKPAAPVHATASVSGESKPAWM
jgi:hypothetical protein